MVLELIAIAVSILTLVLTGVALWVTISQFKKQLELQIFADYTKRYQEITLHFPEAVNQPQFRISGLLSEQRDRTLRYMRAYFDLCSEEYYLWKKGHIDAETWREWETGIKFALSKAAFKEAWRILGLDTIYYGAFSQFVTETMKSDT